jgi:hypothetical protein
MSRLYDTEFWLDKNGYVDSEIKERVTVPEVLKRDNNGKVDCESVRKTYRGILVNTEATHTFTGGYIEKKFIGCKEYLYDWDGILVGYHAPRYYTKKSCREASEKLHELFHPGFEQVKHCLREPK